MKKSTRTFMVVCPYCYEETHLNKKPKLGGFIVCGECEEPLKVIGLSPLKVRWYFGDNGDDRFDPEIGNPEDDFIAYYDNYDWD